MKKIARTYTPATSASASAKNQSNTGGLLSVVPVERATGGAPVASYFMNYVGVDRYRKQGIIFTFDGAAKRFHYDGAAWREILRRYPRSPEAVEARQRLDGLHTVATP